MAEKAKGAEATAEMPFEQALERLEELVAQLEAGELPLEKSLAAFEEGMRLARLCAARLEEAEKRVQALVEQADGTTELEPFEDDEPADDV